MLDRGWCCRSRGCWRQPCSRCSAACAATCSNGRPAPAQRHGRRLLPTWMVFSDSVPGTLSLRAAHGGRARRSQSARYQRTATVHSTVQQHVSCSKAAAMPTDGDGVDCTMRTALAQAWRGKRCNEKKAYNKTAVGCSFVLINVPLIFITSDDIM